MPDAAHVDAAAPSKAEIAEMERKVAQAWKDVPDTNIDVGLYKRKREEYRKLNAKLRDMRKRAGVEGPQFYTGDSAPATVDKLIAAADGLYHRSDAMQNGTWSEQCEGVVKDASGCTFILVDGSVDQVIQHQGNYKAIIEREVKDLKKMDVGHVTTKVFENEAQGYAKYDSLQTPAQLMPNLPASERPAYLTKEEREALAKSRSVHKDADTPKYNPGGVNQAIAAQNRSGRGKIGGREGKMIHALLKGSEGYASRKDADSSVNYSSLKTSVKSKTEDQVRKMIKDCESKGDWKKADALRDILYQRKDSVADSKPATLDSLLSVADELYARSDEVARGEAIEGTADGESIKPGDQVTIKKDVFERMRTAGYNGPRVVRVKAYSGGDVVFTNGGRAKAAEVDCG